jgi:hypothetical protein
VTDWSPQVPLGITLKISEIQKNRWRLQALQLDAVPFKHC